MRLLANPTSTILTALALALGSVGFNVTSAQAVNFSLTYSGTTELTVTGHLGTPPSTLEIPAQVNGVPVTVIGDMALLNINVNRVVLHEGIRSIGINAFTASNIGDIVFPTTLKNIGRDAFSLASITSATFLGNNPYPASDTFEFIGNVYVMQNSAGFSGTFQNFPVTVVTRWKYSNDNDEIVILGYRGDAPADMVVPASLEGRPVVALADSSLANLSLNSVELPTTLRTIGKFALSGNLISSISFPASVTSVGDWAFSGNPNLTSVLFRGNAPTAGNDPFFLTNPNLTSVSAYVDATGFAATWAGHDVTRLPAPSTEATLSLLAPALGSFNQAFSPNLTSYTMNVSGSTSSIQILPNPESQWGTVKINGTPVRGWTVSDPIALVVGDNTITVQVTAQDGVTRITYTLVVTRANLPLSGDASLSALAVNPGSLTSGFSPDSLDYMAQIPYAQSSISVTPTANEAHASITVNDAAVSSGTAYTLNNLAVGFDDVTIVVTAQDGTTRTYSITVWRASPDDRPALQGIVPSTGDLSPAFGGGTLAYTMSVANDTSSIAFTPYTQFATATVKVNGASVATGQKSANISLAVGINTVTVVSTAQDGVTTRTYTITITRAAKVVLSGDSTLMSLIAAPLNIDTAFNSGISNYHVAVPYSQTTADVTAATNEAHATLKINGVSATSGVAVHGIALEVGLNQISIAVTAQDGKSQSMYELFIERAAQSSNSALSSFTGSSGKLSWVFNTETKPANIAVINSVATIKLTATVADSTASVLINGTAVASGSASGDIPLTVGRNVLVATVTAQDGSTTTYTVILTRAAASVALAKPQIAGAVTVTGKHTVGSTLTAIKPKTGGGAATFTLQWYRCNGAISSTSIVQPKAKVCTPNSGAYKSSYVVAKSDKGKYLIVMFTLKNKAGTVYSVSKGTIKTS